LDFEVMTVHLFSASRQVKMCAYSDEQQPLEESRPGGITRRFHTSSS
jgi:hypothetical protein